MKDEEGVVKFNCQWIQAGPLDRILLQDINAWRDKLFASGLIGVTEDGIGYGNISIRHQQNEFIISGSGTGKFEKLSEAHYALVTDYNVEENSLQSTGPIIASSESLTHAMIYEYAKGINAVMHVHQFGLWKHLLGSLPATAPDIEYGTPEMAREIIRLFKEQNLLENKIFAMAGHYSGVVCFGRSLDEAGELLLRKVVTSNK
jgi:L-ribulose-5-phosphate 4-epimerase